MGFIRIGSGVGIAFALALAAPAEARTPKKSSPSLLTQRLLCVDASGSARSVAKPGLCRADERMAFSGTFLGDGIAPLKTPAPAEGGRGGGAGTDGSGSSSSGGTTTGTATAGIVPVCINKSSGEMKKVTCSADCHNNEFYVELLGVRNRAAADSPASRTGAALIAALDRGVGAFRLMLVSDDLDGDAARLAAAGISVQRDRVEREDGTHICDVLRPTTFREAGCEFAILSYPEGLATRRNRHATAGLFTHQLAFKRLDHLAKVLPAA